MGTDQPAEVYIQRRETLNDIREELELLEHKRDELRERTIKLVTKARNDYGLSWREIGHALGITPQSAYSRYRL